MLENLSPEAIEKRKHAPETDGMLEPILARWSPRAFSSREISPADLKKLLEAARWAASSGNEQPWRFLLGRRGDETYQKIFSTLAESNQVWAKSAPVLMLSAARKIFSGGAQNRFCLHDTGAATAYIFLQAVALGFYCHGMGGFDQEMARASFGIPQEFEIGAVIAVGYFGEPGILPGNLREREEAPRERKPLEQFAFSSWETPLLFEGPR